MFKTAAIRRRMFCLENLSQPPAITAVGLSSTGSAWLRHVGYAREWISDRSRLRVHALAQADCPPWKCIAVLQTGKIQKHCGGLAQLVTLSYSHAAGIDDRVQKVRDFE